MNQQPKGKNHEIIHAFIQNSITTQIYNKHLQIPILKPQDS
jgi:hypothetical protein